MELTQEQPAQQESSEQSCPQPETPTASSPSPKKRKRRFGDRKDGRRLRTISPMTRVGAYLMDERCGSQNYITVPINCEKVDKYLAEKKAQGYQITFMHVLIATYIRTVSQYPGVNRFVAGNKIFARNDIAIMLVIKREMSLLSPDTALKGFFEKDATIFDVYNEFNRLIDGYRNHPDNGFDKATKALNYIPGFLLRFAAALMRGLDYIGLLPQALCKVSPFHGSMFITSMGSLGIPPIYHHLYDFGNVPVFLSFGSKYRKMVITEDGEAKKESYIDFTAVLDERICDGFYYASALKHILRCLRNPWVLDTPPAEIKEDIE